MVHCVTYSVIPAQHRILWVNSVDLVWNAIISSAAQKDSVFEEIEGVEEESISTSVIINGTEHVVSINNDDDDVAAAVAVVAAVLTLEVDIFEPNNLGGQANTTTSTEAIMVT